MNVHDHRTEDAFMRNLVFKLQDGDVILTPLWPLYVYSADNGRFLYHVGDYTDGRAKQAIAQADKLKGGVSSAALHFNGEYERRRIARENAGRVCSRCGADLTDKPAYQVGNGRLRCSAIACRPINTIRR